MAKAKAAVARIGISRPGSRGQPVFEGKWRLANGDMPYSLSAIHRALVNET